MDKLSFVLGLFLLLQTTLVKGQLSPDEELNFALEVKQVDEFMERFNFDRSTLLLKYLAKHYPNVQWQRAELIRSLFNSERDWDTTQIEAFIQQVTEPANPCVLDFYQKDWYAELECQVLFKGKIETPTLLLEVHTEPDLAAKWTIRGVKADFLVLSQKDNMSFLNPISHSTDFMGLRKAMGDTANLPSYAFEEFQPDLLSIFMYELQNGTLQFKQVNDIRYHFLQIDQWIIQVHRHLRDSRNSGWLIDDLFQATPDQKQLYRQQVLGIRQ
jgi:hypothetical protein